MVAEILVWNCAADMPSNTGPSCVTPTTLSYYGKLLQFQYLHCLEDQTTPSFSFPLQDRNDTHCQRRRMSRHQDSCKCMQKGPKAETMQVRTLTSHTRRGIFLFGAGVPLSAMPRAVLLLTPTLTAPSGFFSSACTVTTFSSFSSLFCSTLSFDNVWN